MATIKYYDELGKYGEPSDFYNPLKIVLTKHSDTKATYTDTSSHSYVTFYGEDLHYTSKGLLKSGSVEKVLFADGDGDPLLSVTKADYSAKGVATAMQNGGIEGVVAYVLAGDDKIYGSKRGDYIYGAGGEDKLFGGDGKDKILGGSKNDNLYGEDGNDKLDGGTGNDKVFGGAGNDTLYGGKGNDNLYGEGGSDLFLFKIKTGNDKIIGFDADGGGVKQDHVALAEGTHFTYAEVSGSTVLTFDDGSTLTLNKVGIDHFSIGGLDTDVVYL